MSGVTTKGPERIIIDTDPGIDDAMAIFLALGCPDKVKVEGLTVVCGNSDDVDVLADNACHILELAGVQDGSIPVFKGCRKPLRIEFRGVKGIMVHGEGALGGVKIPKPEGLALSLRAAELQRDLDAAQYIVHMCKSHPGEITLVTLGPLTNIAAAIELCPELPKLVRRIVMMGGAVNCPGNVSPVAEANVHNDPTAARIVFESGADIVMAGLNVTRQTVLSEAFRERIRDSCGQIGAFIYDITQHYVDTLNKWNVDCIGVHDSTAVMAVVRPELFQSRKAFVTVEDLEEPEILTVGMTVADFRGQLGREPQTTLLETVDRQGFYDFYVQAVARLDKLAQTRKQTADA